MQIQLRLLTENDSLTYRTLRLKSYQESTFAFSESFEDEQQRTLDDFAIELEIEGNPPEWFVLGAFNNSDKLIGFVKFRRDQRSKARHKAMIHAMYVVPEYRKQGLAQLLINNLLKRVQLLNGLEQIHLWVLHSDGHKSASNFYKKCGFESQGTYVKKDLKIEDKYIDAEYMVFHLH